MVVQGSFTTLFLALSPDGSPLQKHARAVTDAHPRVAPIASAHSKTESEIDEVFTPAQPLETA